MRERLREVVGGVRAVGAMALAYERHGDEHAVLERLVSGEPGRCVRVTVGDLRAAARAADLIEAMLVQESADAALQPPDWWEDVQRERERTMERLFAASGVPRDVLGVDETDAEG